MNTIYLIRHSQAENNVSKVVGGWADPSLTELGRRQAEAVAERLAELLDGQELVLYSSHLKRASETAEIIGDKLNVTPIIDENLRECQRRLPPTLSRQDAEKYAIGYSTPVKDYRMYPNCESFGELYQRAAFTMSNIVKDEERAIVIVSHNWYLDKVIMWWLGIGIDYIKTTLFKISNASISELSKNKYNENILVYLNDTHHLKDVN